ncbi:ATP-dependent zinc protease [Candidatus Saccharibacteria bacterium]|nr:ATP-dependent zinc protease [Candidatus Saccharibacteria bacterium]
MKRSQLPVIGRAEKVEFPELGYGKIVAKVDTGADLSSLWATHIKEGEDGLSFIPFGKRFPKYKARAVTMQKGQYSVTRVANSFGEREVRYVVKLRVKITGKLVLGTFTLANRARKTYPILLGRKLLKGKFLVDVAAGSALEQAERLKRQQLRDNLPTLRDKMRQSS